MSDTNKENIESQEHSSIKSGGLLYCDDCAYLRPKEHEQGKKKEAHMCELLSCPLFHNGHHPHIPRPERCVFYKKVI